MEILQTIAGLLLCGVFLLAICAPFIQSGPPPYDDRFDEEFYREQEEFFQAKEKTMSENKITIGFMAELVTPVGKHTTELWESTQDALYESGSELELTYEGTLVFTKVTHVDSYNFDILIGRPAGCNEFIELCQSNGLALKPDTIKPYFAHWYNGSDSPMSDMTLAKYNEE